MVWFRHLVRLKWDIAEESVFVRGFSGESCGYESVCVLEGTNPNLMGPVSVRMGCDIISGPTHEQAVHHLATDIVWYFTQWLFRLVSLCHKLKLQDWITGQHVAVTFTYWSFAISSATMSVQELTVTLHVLNYHTRKVTSSANVNVS